MSRFHIKVATLLDAIEKRTGDLGWPSLVERSMDHTLHGRSFYWCVRHANDQINLHDTIDTDIPESYTGSSNRDAGEHAANNGSGGAIRDQDDNEDNNKFYLYEDEDHYKSGGFVDNFHVMILRTTVEILIDVACLITVVFALVISPLRVFELITCLIMSPQWLAVWSARQCMRKVMVMDQMIQEFKVELSRTVNTHIKQDAHRTTITHNMGLEGDVREQLNGKYLKSFKRALLDAQSIGNKFGVGTSSDQQLFDKWLPERVRNYEQLLFHHFVMMSAKQWTMTKESMENEDLRERLCIVVQIMDERLKKDAHHLHRNLVACHKSLDETVETAVNSNKLKKSWKKIGIISNPLDVTRGLILHQFMNAWKDLMTLLMLIFIFVTFVRVIPMFREMYAVYHLQGNNRGWINFDQVYLVLRKNVVGAARDIMNMGKFTFYSLIGEILRICFRTYIPYPLLLYFCHTY